MWNPEPLTGLFDDGLYLPVIKRHSLAKIRAHNHNVNVFATATKDSWPQRAYIGLYSGAGRARLEETGEIVETTATAVLRLPYPFTHHVFVDQNENCTTALKKRAGATAPSAQVKVLTGDVNVLLPEVRAALPQFGPGNGLLCYCFVDPFDAGLHFTTIRELGRLRVDFLILLALGLDARRNFQLYLKESDERLGLLIDDPNWRREWQGSRSVLGEGVVKFLMRKFDEAMVRIGYRSAPIEQALPVKVHGKNVLLYHLMFYSKHDLGRKLWNVTRTGIDAQGDFFG